MGCASSLFFRGWPCRLAVAVLVGCGLLFHSSLAVSAFAIENEGTLLAWKDGKYNIWQQGFFRVKFMREGVEAVPGEDLNKNGCPDFVENVAIQLLAAHHVFCDVAGFAAPLKSSRYEGVRYIYVVVRDTRALNEAKGLAYDEISLQNDFTGIVSGMPKGRRVRIPVLTIAISKDIDPKKNRTPTHEYFHMIRLLRKK